MKYGNKIEIETYKGNVTNGYEKGGIACTKCHGGWNLTHVATGMCLGSNVRAKTLAQAAAFRDLVLVKTDPEVWAWPAPHETRGAERERVIEAIRAYKTLAADEGLVGS